jgi:type II secretory pathway component PulK
MTPAAVAIIVLCVVAVSAVLVWTLLALRKTALRAESVLRMVEREIWPVLGQIEHLIAELRDLSQGAKEELSKIRVVVRRAENVSITVSKVLLAVGGLTRHGQDVSLAAGVKKGLDVFVRRLKATR